MIAGAIPDGAGMRGSVVAAIGVVVVIAIGMMIRSHPKTLAPGMVELAHMVVAIAVIVE